MAVRSTALRSALALLLLSILLHPAFAQTVTTAFTYQGELRVSGQASNATHDFQFRLFNAATGGTQIGTTVNANGVSLSDGLFATTVDFGPGQFAGDRQWLEVAVRPAGAGSFQSLSPRNEMTAAPYAHGALSALANSVTSTSIVDGSVQASDILNGSITQAKINTSEVQARILGGCTATQAIRSVSNNGTIVCSEINPGTITGIVAGTGLTGGGTTGSPTLSIANGGVRAAQVNSSEVQLRVIGACPAGQYVRAVAANGGVTCDTDVSGNNNSWSLDGNALTSSLTQFLGSTNSSLTIRANNKRIMYYNNPFANQGANILGGSQVNTINESRPSQTVAGGGRNTNDCGIDGDQPCSNRSDGIASTIGGGMGNATNGHQTTIAGGSANTANGDNSTVSGGLSNVAGLGPSNGFAFVGGGEYNLATGAFSTIGGGSFNEASAVSSTVAGGNGNAASRSAASVLGGMNNSATGQYATVAGGESNCAGATYSFAAGLSAKVRPGSSSGNPALGCESVPTSAINGDFGTFVWSDASGGGDFISTGTNQFLVRALGGFAVNTNTPRARFTVQGNNQTDPSIGDGWGDFTVGDASYGFQIGVDTSGAGAGTTVLWTKGGTEDLVFSNANNQFATMTLRQNGRVGVRRFATTNNFEVEGSASKTTSGSWLANSDARIKTDVQEIHGAVDQLLRLRPVHFRYQPDYIKAHPAIADERYYNVIAQEFAEVFPDAVRGSGEYLPGAEKTAENEIRQVDFHPATVLNIAATQELAVRLEAIEAENRQLRAELAEMRQWMTASRGARTGTPQ